MATSLGNLEIREKSRNFFWARRSKGKRFLKKIMKLKFGIVEDWEKLGKNFKNIMENSGKGQGNDLF